MSYLQIENLTKSYGAQPVLRDVNLSIGKGELFALLGPSGGGKSTLLRIVCGFERAEHGSVTIDGIVVEGAAYVPPERRHIGRRILRRGVDAARGAFRAWPARSARCIDAWPDPRVDGIVVEGAAYVPPERRHIGYVPQEGALFPHLTVAENVAYGLDRAARRSRQRVDELLEIVGLPANYAGRSPQELSGGQQQRVALARALAPRPALVMLDEPFSALDTALRAEMRQAVALALKTECATAILVTHDQSEALSLGHRVAVLMRGHITQIDTPENLYANPADAELASFVGEAVFVPGVAGDGMVDCELGRLPLTDGHTPTGNVQTMIRPEQIRVALPESNGAVSAVAEQTVFFGHDANVDVRLCATGRLVRLRLSDRRFHALAKGSRCTSTVRSSPIRLPDRASNNFHFSVFNRYCE